MGLGLCDDPLQYAQFWHSATIRGLAELGPKVTDTGQQRFPTHLDIYTDGSAGGLKLHGSSSPTPPAWAFCALASDDHG
eukprot:8263558-Pyramimonas_sp.AAC.1